MNRLAALIALSPAVVTSAARADAPADSAAVEAGDANLESTANRRGLVFAASLGGAGTIGLGIEDSVGRGGGLALRVGHVATPRTVITFEVAGAGVLHRPAQGTAMMKRPIETNTDVNLLAGAQYYANPSLWFRLAAGVGNYRGRQVAVGGGVLGDITLTGPALLLGAGVDLARFKWLVLSIEAATTAMANRDGVLLVSGAGLGLQFD